MEKFKFLEHTADAKFQAFGKSMEEAFSNAAIAMFSIFCEPKKVRPKIRKKIKVNGKDLSLLLYKFLEEFLFLLDAESFLLNNVVNIRIFKDKDNYELEAEITGDNIGKQYKLHGEVKAVTYNDMVIDEKKNMVQVVVDL